MHWNRWFAIAMALSCGTVASGIGPANVLVIAAKGSPEGLAIANYYREKRGIPPENVVRVDLAPNQFLNYSIYKPVVLDAVNRHIDKYGLRERIAVWACTPGCPYVIDTANSASGVVFFGKVIAPSDDPSKPGTFVDNNPYFDKFAPAPVPKTPGVGPLHMRIDAGSLDATKKMIDRSMESDGSFPKGTIYLFDGIGPRSSRKIFIAPAKKFLEMVGCKVEHRPEGLLTGAKEVLGIYTGTPRFGTSANSYVPGALADHLTSFGGRLEEYRGQTPARDFLSAGCSATYGTVIEPYNYPAKFPTANLYMYYVLGFSAVESYWMSVLWPQQGIFLGDPLTRPFDVPPSIELRGLSPDQVVRGTFDFDVIARAKPPGPGVLKVDIAIDGKRVFRRVSNTVPEGTMVKIGTGRDEFSYLAAAEEPLNRAMALLTKKALDAGYRVDLRNGLLTVLSPSTAKQKMRPTSSTTSPLVHLEVVGATKETPKSTLPAVPASSATRWKFEGNSSPGDELVLRINEGGKQVAEIRQKIEFDRPAASIVTSFRLEASKKLPMGYSLRAELLPNNRESALLDLVVDSKRLSSNPSASLDLRKSADSKLAVTGNSSSQEIVGNVEAFDLATFRFAIGPSESNLRPRVDTAPFADGRHILEFVVTKGSATETASILRVPIVIRNGTSQMKLEAIEKSLSMSPGGKKLPVVRAMPPEGSQGRVVFFVNHEEIPAAEVQSNALLFDPTLWGEGRHEVTARLREGERDTLFSENSIVLEVKP